MPTLRVACPGCGNVKVTPDGVALERRGATGTYAFACPGCGERVLRIAGPHQMDRLLRSGVRAPGRVDPPGPPPLTPADLAAFSRLLAADDWRHRLDRLDRLGEDPGPPE